MYEAVVYKKLAEKIEKYNQQNQQYEKQKIDSTKIVAAGLVKGSSSGELYFKNFIGNNNSVSDDKKQLIVGDLTLEQTDIMKLHTHRLINNINYSFFTITDVNDNYTTLNDHMESSQRFTKQKGMRAV